MTLYLILYALGYIIGIAFFSACVDLDVKEGFLPADKTNDVLVWGIVAALVLWPLYVLVLVVCILKSFSHGFFIGIKNKN